VAALRPEGITAPAVFDGPIDTASFRAYVEQVLAPTLRPGDGSAAAMDDVSSSDTAQSNAFNIVKLL
jgi:hypothetical protein